MNKALAVFLLTTTLGLTASERPKSNVHVSHLSQNTVGVTCINGADPTGRKIGDILLISCGE